MDKKDMQSLKPIYPIHVQKYNEFIPKPENENFISKLNSVIDYLTRIGSLNNQTVKQWNEVMKWITEEGLENITEEEVVKQFESYKEEADSISGELKELKIDVDEVITKGDEAKTKGDYAKSQGDYAKVQAVKSEEQYNRLKDTDVGTLSDQLEKETKKFDVQPVIPKTIIGTIVFDDGWNEDYTVMFPYFKSKGIKGSSALISSFVDVNPNYMGMDKINEMKTYGWEFQSHTVDHLDLSLLDRSQIDYQLRESKRVLESKGLAIESIVFPYNHYNKDVLDITRRYYKYAFARDEINGTNWVNYAPYNEHSLYRINLEDPLSKNQPYIDEAIVKKGWIVFMGHGHYYNPIKYPDTSKWPGKWDDNIQKVKDNIEYCLSKGVQFKTAKEAYELSPNVISIGDDKLSEDTFRVSKTGEIVSKSLDKKLESTSVLTFKDGVLSANDPISVYEDNKITVVAVMSTDTILGYPTEAGQCHTYKFGGRAKAGELSFQLWYPHNNNNVYIRHWQSWNKTWGNWGISKPIASDERISKILAFTMDVPDIPANGAVTLQKAVTGLKANSAITINVRDNALSTDVDTTARCNIDGNLVIVMRNYRSSVFTGKNVSFTISYINV